MDSSIGAVNLGNCTNCTLGYYDIFGIILAPSTSAVDSAVWADHLHASPVEVLSGLHMTTDTPAQTTIKTRS